jgi:hypothetical protein
MPSRKNYSCHIHRGIIVFFSFVIPYHLEGKGARQFCLSSQLFFVAFVRQLTEIAPEDVEPVAIDAVAVSANDTSEPIEVN